MTESKLENVSSLIDGYQVDDKVLEEMANDSQLSDTWERYHVVSSVLRNEAPDTLDFDLSEQIFSAIADEPTILAPQTKPTFIRTMSAKVVQFAKPIGQMAIAASAAGLMVMGVQQTNVADNEILPAQVIQTNPLGGFAEPVSYNYQPNTQKAQQQAYMEQQRRFQALLLDHQQQVKFSASQKSASEKVLNAVEDKDSSQ